jgi:hypothetical protein
VRPLLLQEPPIPGSGRAKNRVRRTGGQVRSFKKIKKSAS